MCIHVASIVFVSIRVPRNWQSDWASGVWVHHCVAELCTFSSHCRLWCWVGCMPYWSQCLSGVMSDKRKRGVPNPALNQQRQRMFSITCCTYTFACWSIYHLFPQIWDAPPATTILVSCKEHNKMKFNIALRQNCNQSATVWSSTQSSAQPWMVRLWCLTWKNSTDSNRETN